VRLFEIASAEEQIELWKLISTSVWQSLQVLEKQQQEAAAQAAARAKSAPAKRGAAKKLKLPAVPVPNSQQKQVPQNQVPVKAQQVPQDATQDADETQPELSDDGTIQPVKPVKRVISAVNASR
jgi:hypothetical protein